MWTREDRPTLLKHRKGAKKTELKQLNGKKKTDATQTDGKPPSESLIASNEKSIRNINTLFPLFHQVKKEILDVVRL